MCDLKMGKETNAFCNKALKIVGEEKQEHNDTHRQEEVIDI